MNSTVCKKDSCCGCNACKIVCPKNAIEIIDSIQSMNAVVDDIKCINCGRCESVCPNVNKPIFQEPIYWTQGWAQNKQIRENSSSGGFAKVISYYYVDNGGYVCSCVFRGGKFIFQLSKTREQIDDFTGSKYVKSNPEECYKEIILLLREQKKVLFIGLPCQVAALKNYVGDKYKEYLLTVDLICHGTPSQKVLEMFFKEHNIRLQDVKDINFRKKDNFGISGNVSFSAPGVLDSYSLAFLTGTCYTENCYQCQYAKIERVSDITIGDSWGTNLTNELSKGISLVLCQNEKAVELVKKLDFEMHDVNLSKAIESNHQLQKPSTRPSFLDDFYKSLNAGMPFSKLVFKYRKIKYVKQLIKTILFKIGIYNRGV